MQQDDANLKSIAYALASRLDQANQHSATVLDFTDLQGSPTELGRFLAQELSGLLVAASKNVSFVDRANLQVLLREHRLSTEGLVNPESIQKIGKLIGIDTIIIGTTTPPGDTIRLSVRAIAVETGRIVASQSTNLPATGALLALSNRGVEDTSFNPSSSSEVSPSAAGKSKAGWAVQIHTYMIENGRYVYDGNKIAKVETGTIAAYTQTGSEFSFESALEHTSGSQQNVFPAAAAKFIVQVPGSYQLGGRIEILRNPGWWIGCLMLMSVDGKPIIHRIVGSRGGDAINEIAITPAQLARGAHDANVEFRCIDPGTAQRQIRSGKLTILVSHPGELGPEVARSEDFILPTSGSSSGASSSQ
jgi:curli biogenesis system outer membrane secretion channel CsgG